MEKDSKVNYTLNYVKITDLKGVACQNNEQPGDVIIINGVERKIKEIVRYEISWYVRSKQLIISEVTTGAGEQVNVTSFLKSIGFLEKKAFMRRFFVKFDITELKANSLIRVGWFL